MATTYPEDEFDRQAAERTTVGVHRAPSSSRPWVIALIAVLVLAPLLGIGIGKLVAGSDSPAASETTATSEASAAAASTPTEVTTAPSTVPTTAPTTAPTAPTTAPTAPTPEPSVSASAAEPNLAHSVLVLNGRGTSGLAGQKARVLKSAGFTNTAVGDYKSQAPAESTIYYSGREFAGTAKLAGEKLGIVNLVDDAARASQLGSTIVVILR